MTTAEIVSTHFSNLNSNQLSQFDRLPFLYRDWNEKINVVSRKDIEELPIRHVLHSLAIAKFIQFKPGSKILDLGTGGGFPGIPLAILFPSSNFHLVDSIGKKIQVVQAITAELQLENVSADHIRGEKLKSKYNYIVTRAVTRSKTLWSWTHNKFLGDPKLDEGIIALKGGDLDEELEELKRPYQEIDISNFFKEPFFSTKKIIFVPR